MKIERSRSTGDIAIEVSSDDLPETARQFLGLDNPDGDCERCEKTRRLRPFPLVENGSVRVIDICRECQREFIQVARQQGGHAATVDDETAPPQDMADAVMDGSQPRNPTPEESIGVDDA